MLKPKHLIKKEKNELKKKYEQSGELTVFKKQNIRK